MLQLQETLTGGCYYEVSTAGRRPTTVAPSAFARRRHAPANADVAEGLRPLNATRPAERSRAPAAESVRTCTTETRCRGCRRAGGRGRSLRGQRCKPPTTVTRHSEPAGQSLEHVAWQRHRIAVGMRIFVFAFHGDLSGFVYVYFKWGTKASRVVDKLI